MILRELIPMRETTLPHKIRPLSPSGGRRPSCRLRSLLDAAAGVRYTGSLRVHQALGRIHHDSYILGYLYRAPYLLFFSLRKQFSTSVKAQFSSVAPHCRANPRHTLGQPLFKRRP